MKLSESVIQQQIILHFRNNNLKNGNLIFSIPNGGKSQLENSQKKNIGMLAGASDLIVLFPNRCVFVEVKTDVGYQSPTQKEFESQVKNLGFEYYLVRSLEDFKKIK